MKAVGQKRVSKAVGRRLRSARLAAGYRSAAAGARALGLEAHTYRKYERGEADFLRKFELICGGFGVTPNDLLGFTTTLALLNSPRS